MGGGGAAAHSPEWLLFQKSALNVLLGLGRADDLAQRVVRRVAYTACPSACIPRRRLRGPSAASLASARTAARRRACSASTSPPPPPLGQLLGRLLAAALGRRRRSLDRNHRLRRACGLELYIQGLLCLTIQI